MVMVYVWFLSITKVRVLSLKYVTGIHLILQFDYTAVKEDVNDEHII